jgi:hypothetical protein
VATRVELLEILLPDIRKELNGILLELEPKEKNVLPGGWAAGSTKIDAGTRCPGD